MTPKEAIDNLKYMISDDCTDTQVDFVDEIEMAIEALEKQITKKPMENVVGYYCSECKRLVESVHYYCGICGQAIDWGEEE